MSACRVSEYVRSISLLSAAYVLMEITRSLGATRLWKRSTGGQTDHQLKNYFTLLPSYVGQRLDVDLAFFPISSVLCCSLLEVRLCPY